PGLDSDLNRYLVVLYVGGDVAGYPNGKVILQEVDIANAIDCFANRGLSERLTFGKPLRQLGQIERRAFELDFVLREPGLFAGRDRIDHNRPRVGGIKSHIRRASRLKVSAR